MPNSNARRTRSRNQTRLGSVVLAAAMVLAGTACGPRFDPRKVSAGQFATISTDVAGSSGIPSVGPSSVLGAGPSIQTSTITIPPGKNITVTGGEIKVGGLFPESGGLSTLGLPAEQGAKAYFKWVDDQGGIDGKKITFLPCDDRADDTLSTECSRKLVEQDGIFVMGPSFTPFSFTPVSYLEGAGVPWIGYDGINVEGFSKSNVVTIGAPIDSMGHALLPYWYHKIEHDTGSPPKNIGAIVLDSAPAKTYVQEAQNVICKKLGCNIDHVSYVSYTDTQFQTQCSSMTGDDAIWIVTDPASAVKILAQCPKPPKGWLGQHGIYLDLTLEQAGRNADGILSNSAIVPDTMNTPATAQMKQIITRYFPRANFGYFTGLAFASARMLCDLVKKVLDAGQPLNRENMLKAASGVGSYDCGGLCKNVNLKPPAAQSGGNHNVWIVRADFSSGKGKWMPEAGPIDAFTVSTWPCPGRPKPC